MAEPYAEEMISQALRLRWISVQCYEMVLPGGKVLVCLLYTSPSPRDA